MTITHEQAQQAVAEHGWRLVGTALEATFDTGSFSAGAHFVARIAEAADAANHHPDVDLRYPTLTVHLTSHDVGDVTDRDVDLALTISAIASELGYLPQP